MSHSFLQAIISGNPLDLPGLGRGDSGLTILFPLSSGNTVNDLANALNVPVDTILAVNPGLQADSPLSVSQVVGLPDDRVDQIMQSVTMSGGRSYVPTPAPSSSAPTSTPTSELPPPSGASPGGYADDQGVNVSVRVALPSLRSMATALDIFDVPQQTVSVATQIGDDPDGWIVTVNPAGSLTGASESLEVSTTLAPVSMSQPSPSPSSSSPAPATASPSSVQPAEPQTTTTATPPASNDNPGNVAVAASSQPRSESEDAFNVVQAPNAAARAAQNQDRQRNPGSDFPPPMPMDPKWFAGQATVTAPSSSIGIAAPAVTMNTANLVNSSTALQWMALLVAQSGGSLAAGASAPAPQQGQPFIDPQALAAFAAAMRTTKVVDLGAGRSMEFSLVNDRLRRIDPIGQDDRAASRRRTGDGLDEVRVGRPDSEDVEQTDEEREQGRRRRAAIAAMRRRRQPRSRRCRYWRGTRRDLSASATRCYPKRVDWAEFRSRQLPRYLWNVGSGDPK